MLQERCVLRNGFLMEIVLHRPGQYRLSLRQGRRLLVEYRSTDRTPFKSVEKLRYDFERDVEKALRQG